MKIYLAGPMSGIPQFNFPEFKRVSAQLRAKGWDVVSPAELDEAESEAVAMASNDGNPQNAHRTWGHYLARDVKLIADENIEGIIFLYGWENSRGARLEAFVGTQIKGMKFFRYFREGDSFRLVEVSAAHVLACLDAYTSQWINDNRRITTRAAI